MIIFVKFFRIVAGWPRRKLLTGSFIFLCAVGLLMMIKEYTSLYRRELVFHDRHVLLLQRARARSKANGSLNSVCVIPDPDPFDPTVMQYYEKFTLKCSNTSYLVFVDENGFIHLNKSGFEAINKTFEQIHCTYKSIHDVPGRKKAWTTGTVKNISVVPQKIGDEFVCSKCYEGSEVIYENCHFYIPPPSERLKQKNKKLQDSKRTNVLLLGIDSLSRLGFIRNLPKSYEFLTKRLGSTVMKGFNKVGLNTEPNLIPFLTGYSYYKPTEINPGPTPSICADDNDNCTGYFDNAPIVWKNFSQEGYVTMYFEEWLLCQLFHYCKKGFKRGTPTDYYPRPLIRGLENAELNNDDLCYGNTPTYDVLLDYTDKFIKTMKDTIYFAFSFIVRINHDSDMRLQAADDSLQRTLEKLYTNGVFNDTIFVMFGDHGRRYGNIRNTMLGALEARMPFLSIYLPHRLRREKPHLQAALELNKERLASWYDMYEMLMDLAMDNLEEVSRVTRWGFHVGLSPLRPLPANRTCAEAGIPVHYCACVTPLDVDVGEDGVAETAAFLVDHVNAILREVPGWPCAHLRLYQIENAQVMSHSDAVVTAHGLIEYLRVTVTTVPGLARFQGTVTRSVSHRRMKVQGVVDRLNMYRHQSACVTWYPDSTVHSYCFCPSTQENRTSGVNGSSNSNLTSNISIV